MGREPRRAISSCVQAELGPAHDSHRLIGSQLVPRQRPGFFMITAAAEYKSSQLTGGCCHRLRSIGNGVLLHAQASRFPELYHHSRAFIPRVVLSVTLRPVPEQLSAWTFFQELKTLDELCTRGYMRVWFQDPGMLRLSSPNIHPLNVSPLTGDHV